MVILPKLSSAALVPLFQPKNRYYIIIIPKLSSAALVPLFQPKNSYQMDISPKLSSAALVPLFNLKTGIIWSFYQNYHLLPWYPCFNLKTAFACSSIWLKPLSSQNIPRFCHPGQCRQIAKCNNRPSCHYSVYGASKTLNRIFSGQQQKG